MPFWKKKAEEPVEPVKPARKKETLSSVSEKLILRRMKRDPDGYGIEAAERFKGMRREDGSVASELKRFREVKDLLSELAGEGAEQPNVGGWLGLLQTALQTEGGQQLAGAIGQLIAKARQQPPNIYTGDAGIQPRKVYVVAGPDGAPEELPEAEYRRRLSQPQQGHSQQRPPVQRQDTEFVIKADNPGDIFSLISQEDIGRWLEMEPDQVIAELKSRDDDFSRNALAFLSSHSYADIKKMIEPYGGNALFAPLVNQFLSRERKTWILTLLEQAKNSV